MAGDTRPPDKPDGTQVASNSMTSAWAVDGASGKEVKMRSYAEIIAEEREQRNILEIKLTRLDEADGSEAKAKALTFDDIGELIFDVLHVDQSDCIGFNYSTGRYNTREIKFKPGIDLSPYVKSAFMFKGHEVSTMKQMKNAVKVSFRNVPFSVPDEEIIELCKCYGTPVNNRVHYEKMANMRNRGMVGSTRWVEMEFRDGVCMNNFYWVEGPLPGDVGSRITVLHAGQEQQCSNCLRSGRGGCKTMGNGKACAQLGTPRAKMTEYMAELKQTVGYESLKSQYLRQYPSLSVERSPTMEDHDEYEDDNLLPTNPIERRDNKIAELEKEVSELSVIKENNLKIKAELKLAVKKANIANAKVKFARKITEERLKECLPDPSFENEHSNVIVALMSSLLDEDSFELDPTTESLKPKENFLKDIEDSLEVDQADPILKDRLEDVKNRLLDRVKSAPNRFRRLSMSSTSSIDRKRKGSSELVSESVRSKPTPNSSSN